MDANPKDINRLRLEVEQKLVEWVNGNKSRRHVVTTSLVAKQIGVTTKQLESYYDQVIKIGFYAWLARLRVIDAKEVIEQHSEWDDSQVADYVGFDSADEFISAYVRINGMTPSEWRDTVFWGNGIMPPHIKRIVDKLDPYISEWESKKGYCEKSVSRKELMKRFDTYEAEFDIYYSSVFQASFEQRLEYLRVEEAKRIMTDNPSVDSSALAAQVGYSSPFVFYQAFHKLTKQTTTEWRISRGLCVSDGRKDSFPFDDEPVVEWVKKKGYCTPRLTIKDVAKQLGFAENRLAQFLWLKENCSFAEWIDKLRLEESKRLLARRPRLTSKQVEERVGYSGRLPFGKWFEGLTGMSIESWQDGSDRKS